jgi:translocation and assembly module TamA
MLNADLTVAEHFQGLGIAYSIPSKMSIDTATTLQLNLQRENVNDILSKLMALELDRTVGFGDKRVGTAFIRLQQELYSVGSQESTAYLLLPGLRFTQRNFDDLIRPTQGYNYSLEVRGTHRLLGSDVGFLQCIAEGSGITALPGRFSIQARAKSAISILDDPFSDLPTSLRFFAGGDNSVRGYAYKSLGPRGANGEVVGGKHLLQGGIELERAFFDRWGISLFYDAGNAFNSFADYQIYQGAGIGLHYHTPIGAVNLSLARQLGVANPANRVHFTIGFQL